MTAETGIVAALADPRTYAHRPDHVEVRETHISMVFLAGARAFKLKKPLVLDFLDYGTPERRREMCEEEVRLNRRLAPDIYVGVVGVGKTAEGVRLLDAGDPRASDFLVEMRRYDDIDTLDAHLSRGRPGAEVFASIGRLLARFHGEARPVRVAGAPALAVERTYSRNLDELLGYCESLPEADELVALGHAAHGFIRRHEACLSDRAHHRRIREGHGDLRAEHVVLGDRIRIVDCVEFDPALRQLDVADDLAFLVFDLTRLGAPEAADQLVRAYREAGGDPGSDALVSFYAGYRAAVRAKVALVRGAQAPAGPERASARREAAALLALAGRFAWRARLPLILVLCGAPAAGKTTLAGAVCARSGLPHLSTDRVRKELAGVEPTARASGEVYSRAWSERTYATLGRRAAEALRELGGAVVDGTFRHAADRRAFFDQLNANAPVLVVECRAPARVLERRAVGRAKDGARVSDADPAVVRRESTRWDPLDELPASAHVILRTDRAGHELVGELETALDDRLSSKYISAPASRRGSGDHALGSA